MMSQLQLSPLLAEERIGEQTLYHRRFKRAFDVLFGLVALILALPIITILGLMIRASLGPGVFYTQMRVGDDGQPFKIWKFRTMQMDRRAQNALVTENESIEADRRRDHKQDNDPRHTAVGRVLRRLSLDELPQLWNVVRGEMSLVGPRPEIPEVAEARGYLDHVRHTVRPGITGPYQVSDLRHAGDLRDGLELDADYANNITLRGDVGYILRTFTALTRGSGS